VVATTEDKIIATDTSMSEKPESSPKRARSRRIMLTDTTH